MNSTNPAGADDHGPSGPPAPEVIARGYEADGYDTKSVLSVPLLVVLFFVLAFGTVTVIFSFIYPTKADPRAHPGAVNRGKVPLNERLARIKRGGEVDQPRLEPLRVRSGESRAITRPEVEGKNSPELHPEDIRVTKDRFPELYGTEPGKMGLDKTLGMSDDALKSLFPAAAKGAGSAPTDSRHAPSAANAGQGFGDSRAAPVPLPQSAQPKPPEPPPPPKKEEKK
jgi:hypothetical protein